MRYVITILLALITVTILAQSKINNCEYWFNTDATRTKISLSPSQVLYLDTSINITALPEGLHTFHINFKDENAQSSLLTSHFFYKYASIQQVNKKITGYQYWFDNNELLGYFQNIISTQTFALIDSLNVDQLSDGLHIVSFRFKDEYGQWSGVCSQFFYKFSMPSTSIKRVSGYQYWYDGNESSGVVQSITQTDVFTFFDSLNLSALPEGLHFFSIRFKDNTGEWSSCISQFFYKYSNQISNIKKLNSIEYWFDSDYSGRAKQIFPSTGIFIFSDSLEITTISEGLHTLSIRFLDDAGQWSGTISQFFYNEKKETNSSNTITGYRYWFDNMDTSLNLVDIVPFINPIVLDTTIILDGVDSGKHMIHFQFKDVNGVWTMATSDSITTLAKATFTFNGNGKWSNANNWVNKIKPPSTLTGTYKIFIDPIINGNCILDVNQHISSGGILTVRSGKSFIIPDQLRITNE